MAVLTTHFPNLDLTPGKISIYHQTLSDLSEVQLQAAVRTFCLAHEEIYPGTNLIAKLRKYALGHHNRETAAEAWEKVLCGAKGQQVFLDNEISERVVAFMGGFQELGNSTNTIADRAHFMRMYDVELDRANFRELSDMSRGSEESKSA
jgi:hypothetical protein